MTPHRFATLFIVTSVLVACASVPMARKSVEHEAKTFVPTPGKARIYLFRERNVLGAAIQFQALLDGKVAGGTAPGTFFMWEVNPGKHSVSSVTRESVSTIEIDARPDQIYFVRQRQKVGIVEPRIELLRIKAAEGREAISSYRMVQSLF